MELLILNQYAQFVGSAFFFTFLSCFLLYFKTKKEFQKQEKIFFNEFKKLQTIKIKVAKKKANKKAIYSGSSI